MSGVGSTSTMTALLRDLTRRLRALELRSLSGGSGSLPPGFLGEFGGPTPPDGWLVRDGSAVSRTTYAALFAAIGTTYGPGNGTTTFNLPNDQGRVNVGLDPTQVEFDAIGKTGGSKTHTLTAAQMPVHTHTTRHVPATQFGNPGGSGFSIASSTNLGTTGNTGTAGSGAAHPNLQPYSVVLKVIKT